MELHRFWLTFEAAEAPYGLALGCGVTALGLDDALFLVRQYLGHEELPSPKSVIEDVDVSTLDQGHVLPNMLPPNERGVWFPMSPLR